MEPLKAPVKRYHDWEPLTVQGALPKGLVGTLIRTGPGVFSRFGKQVGHSFEADGVMTALRFGGDGRAHAAVRVVEGPEYLAEERAGRAHYGSLAPRWRRIVALGRGRGKSVGNTSLMQWRGRTFALVEGALPVEIDPRTLAAKGAQNPSGVVRSGLSAHPHRLESAKTLFTFNYTFGVRPDLELYAFPDRGTPSLLGRVRLPWNTMVHDFAVTERYAVFVVCPAKLNVPLVLSGSSKFERYFDWDAKTPAQLLVVPLSDPSRVRRIPLDARWVFHLTNAREQNGELIIDWVEYPDFEVFQALSVGRELRFSLPHLTRVRVDIAGRRIKGVERLMEDGCEFPIVPAAQYGGDYRASWYVVGTEFGAGGVGRFDPRTGALDAWYPGQGYQPSEAIFVPKPGATRDDEGWLIDLVYDANEQTSFFAILDADRPSRGPLATLPLGQAVPLTYHGIFLP